MSTVRRLRTPDLEGREYLFNLLYIFQENGNVIDGSGKNIRHIQCNCLFEDLLGSEYSMENLDTVAALRSVCSLYKNKWQIQYCCSL